MICVSLGNMDFRRAYDITSRSEMVEIRYDLLSLSGEELDLLLKTPAKKIFTYRAKEDSSGNKRIPLYNIAVKANVDYLDLDYYDDHELIPAVKEILKNSTTGLILSSHNYEKTPPIEELKSMIREIKSEEPGLVKIACMVNSDEDLVNLLSLYRNPTPKLVLGMGEKGMLSRVAALFMGAPFSFASADKDSATAPGQLTVEELQEIYSIMNA